MVFTNGQILGIGALTAVVLLVGGLLLKLDTMIGRNHDLDGDALPDPQGPIPTTSSVAAATTVPGSKHRIRRGRRH